MQARDKWVHFVMSQEELERMQQKMDELGIRNKSSYLRKMALDGYCVNLELDDVKEMVSLLQARRDHTGGSEPIGTGAGSSFYQRQVCLHCGNSYRSGSCS